MMSYPLATAVTALVALLGVACARSPSPDLSTATATAAPAVAPAADDDEVEPTGSLVIHDDVVRRCPNLRKFQARDEDVGVDAIRAVGECMTRGGLRTSRLVVSGGGRAMRLFDEALGRVGVADRRLDKVVNDSDEADRRVEIGLSRHPLPGTHDNVVLAIRKSEVVGFLIAGSLDD